MGHMCVIVSKCKMHAFVFHHTLLLAFSFETLLFLQTYDHHPSTTCFHNLSASHLSIPNDAEIIRIIIFLVRQESNA